MNTLAESTIHAKVVRRRGGPACPDCKSKKKKCTHRCAGDQAANDTPAANPIVHTEIVTRKRKQVDEDTQAFAPSSISTAAPPINTSAPSESTSTMASKRTRGAKKGTVKKTKGKTKKKAQEKVEREPTPPSSDDSEPQLPKRTKRIHLTNSNKAVPESSTNQYVMPDHPRSNMEGSMRLSVHSVFSRRLEERLNQMEDDYSAAVISARSVINLIAEWKAAWESGK